MGEGFTYQVYETYYARAKEAETQDRIREAKTLYALAGEALLKAARKSDGAMKRALVERADKLLRLADLLEVPETKGERQSVRAEEPKNEKSFAAAEKPGVRFEDIAGLADVKESIRKRIILPRKHPEVYRQYGRKPAGGILLYGPPGTGKTMIAKAVATEVEADFYSIRCSDIVGKYFGEAEKNVKALFETARSSSSAVIFFDEFEALAGRRGGESQVMNRLVPELLSQMDGFAGTEEGRDLLFLAATNRPYDLDTAFLRPPRLTEKIYVGLPDLEARLYLIGKLFAEVPQAEDFRIREAAERTEGYNAADVTEVCGAVKDRAILRTIREGGAASPVCREDLDEVLYKIRSSVRREDLDAIRQWEVRA